MKLSATILGFDEVKMKICAAFKACTTLLDSDINVAFQIPCEASVDVQHMICGWWHVLVALAGSMHPKWEGSTPF